MTANFHELRIEAILEDELYTNPPLMPVVVAKLTGTKQDIPRLFRMTKDIASVADLKHLRRIRDVNDGMDCIVCGLAMDCQTDRLAHDVDQLTKAHAKQIDELEIRFASEKILENYRVQLVPREAPRTEKQLEACKRLWPCKYAKSNYLNKCIEGSVFDAAEQLVIKLIANELLRYIRSSKCTSGAVIFRCAQVYGVGLSSRETLRVSNPTKHSAMLAIDSVAQGAGASSWKCHGDKEAVLQNSIQQLLNEQPELEDHKLESDFSPYLCTNYDVILTEEPCMICTMGLVQSRIRRMFYFDVGSVNSLGDHHLEPVCYPDGAIEKFLVHRDKSLNHRFEAWRIKLV